MKSCLDAKRTKEVSNQLLRKKDSGFNHLLHSSLRVVLFKYEGEWMKTGIDGPVYVYRRKSIPTMGLVILNRKAPHDFQLLIDRNIIEIEVEDQFIMVKKAQEKEVEVFGIWFYEMRMAVQVSLLLSEQIDLLKKSETFLHYLRTQK
ncbi:hypothetical protein NECID01_1141 [Nematocida sp. AWRm77]|nr:hypothetical protein NECID01_1141 [Nematocida sp. AWRm77]